MKDRTERCHAEMVHDEPSLGLMPVSRTSGPHSKTWLPRPSALPGVLGIRCAALPLFPAREEAVNTESVH